jgi:hypothetical protein
MEQAGERKSRNLMNAANRTRPIFVGVLVGVSVWGVARLAAAQAIPTEAIRVQSNQVLVPVVVADTQREQLLQPSFDWQVWQKQLESLVMRGLMPKDFRLQEDGVEQKIGDVNFERVPYWNFRDQAGYHSEVIGPGGGRWTGPEWNPPRMLWQIWPPHYVLAYTPPNSPEGSCHSIRVQVDRPNAVVYARREYCNIAHSASDPLKGTKLDHEMQTDLNSVKDGKFHIGLATAVYFSDSGVAQVQVAVDIPGSSLEVESQESILGTIYSTDKVLAARFSDLSIFGNQVPVRYETQVSLPPGQYSIRIVFRDGSKFGRSEMPLTVDTYDKTRPGVSGIALCHQIRKTGTSLLETQTAGSGAWPVEMPGGFAPLISKGVEFIPTASPSFDRSEPVYAYFEVYDPLIVTLPTTSIKVHLRILTDMTGQVVEDLPPFDGAAFITKGDPVIRIGPEIRSDDLATGLYRLEVQATDSSGQSSIWRSVEFSIK